MAKNNIIVEKQQLFVLFFQSFVDFCCKGPYYIIIVVCENNKRELGNQQLNFLNGE